jgi:hypothetical protein
LTFPTLSAAQLFTPTPSGIGAYGNVPAIPATGTWFGQMLTVATRVGLPTTSWQPGAPERTIFAVEAVTFASSDVNASIIAQAGFLQSAASGSVTVVNNDGSTTTIPVTPDPSNASQNPTGSLGWLDLLVQSTYGVQRLPATYCSGPLAIANTKATAVGPYIGGAYHVANAATGSTYSNPASLTIPSSIIGGSGGTVSAIATGTATTILTTAAPHGLAVNQVAYVSVPTSAGVSGLAGIFAVVIAVTPSTLQIAAASSGTYTSGGTIYSCTIATMQADVAGIASNASPGAVNVAVTQNAGVYVSNVSGWAGSNWESNTALVARTLLSLASRSPNGPAQAYTYYAQSAATLLSAKSPPYTLTNGPVVANAFGNPATGIVTVVCASSTPASTTLGGAVTPGCAQLHVTGATAANPCVITTASPHGIPVGSTMTVTISGLLGLAGVNGTWLATYVSATTFSIPVNTSSAGAWSGGGQVEGGDLGQIDALLQANVTPDNTTALAVSALALPITITATVTVPQAYVASYRIAALAQLATQIAIYPLGGYAASTPPYSVPWTDILSALEEAGVVTIGGASYVEGVSALSVSGNGSTILSSGLGIAFPSNLYQAILSTVSLSVLGV